MLILTQRSGNQNDNEVVITIPPGSIDTAREIRVVVLGVKGNQIRIGYECEDKSIAIDRLAIYERKKAQGEFK
jgi:sRNA-binding carbon storage regulator CsrA